MTYDANEQQLLAAGLLLDCYCCSMRWCWLFQSVGAATGEILVAPLHSQDAPRCDERTAQTGLQEHNLFTARWQKPKLLAHPTVRVEYAVFL